MDPRELPPDSKLFLAADLCRPESGDLESLAKSGLLGAVGPEALRRDAQARLYFERSQAFDAAVESAFADVAVPSGSLERVLLAVADEAAPASPDLVPASANATFGGAPEETRFSRRRWLAACGSAAATTAAGFGLFFWWQSRQRIELTLDDVLAQAATFVLSPDGNMPAAVPVTKESAPPEFPLSRAIAVIREVPRWRPLDGHLFGRRGASYELAAPADKRAVMFVMADAGFGRAPLIPALPNEPMYNPRTTAGLAQGAWREEGRIVVFVVEGDAARYRSFLTSPREIA